MPTEEAAATPTDILVDENAQPEKPANLSIEVTISKVSKCNLINHVLGKK